MLVSNVTRCSDRRPSVKPPLESLEADHPLVSDKENEVSTGYVCDIAETVDPDFRPLAGFLGSGNII